ncbi:hypothetical protein TCON_1318 [Astathelohania contejeani]|uniref:Uncharacterized protein n=1 Tax=Astathelohania contejeani TaxID=164912 RepID=A0ABQ7HZ41_9MICR|nr:hypothetical protein TCON_1318 [Thelohania contejeani]
MSGLDTSNQNEHKLSPKQQEESNRWGAGNISVNDIEGENEDKESAIWMENTYTGAPENEYQYNMHEGEENILYQRLGLQIRSIFQGERKLSEPRRPKEQKNNHIEEHEDVWAKQHVSFDQEDPWNKEETKTWDKEDDKGWGDGQDIWGN